MASDSLDRSSNHSSTSSVSKAGDVESRSVRSSSSQHRQLVLRRNESVEVIPEKGLKMKHSDEPQVFLFGQDLSTCSPNVQFGICTCGVFTFNVLYGYLQELLAVHIAGRKFALFLAVCQFAGYAFWAYILSKLNRASPAQRTPSQGSRVPAAKFVALSLLRAFDLAVTNSAMQFLNYPAKTLIKSCRVVFTMLMGVLIQRKRYKIRDYFAVLTLVLGLLVFLHADSSTDAVFHPLGVILLTVSLICDGTLNNWSEQMMEQYDMGQDEFHSRLYVVSLIATLVAAHMRNELVEGIDYFLLRPGTVTEIESGDLIGDTTWTASRKAVVLILLGTSGIMGASCLGAITKRFGALSMALTSTARKATTLFLSFAIFENNCTSEHVAGVSLFMFGLLMKTFNKRSSSQTAGEKPEEGKKKNFRLDQLMQVFTSTVGAIPCLKRNDESMASIMRRRSSVDMELGNQYND